MIKEFCIGTKKIILRHNQITGHKLLSCGREKLLEIERNYFETKNSHQIEIDGSRYILTVIPLWNGGFDYSLDLHEPNLEDSLLC